MKAPINAIFYICNECNETFPIREINTLLLRSRRDAIHQKIDEGYALFQYPSLKDPQLKILCEREQIDVYTILTKFLKVPEVGWECPSCYNSLKVHLVCKIHERLMKKQHQSYHIEALHILDIGGFELRGSSGLFTGQEILQGIFEVFMYRWTLLKGKIVFYTPFIDTSGWRRMALLCRSLRELSQMMDNSIPKPSIQLITPHKGFIALLNFEKRLEEKIKKGKKTKQIAEEVIAWDALKEFILDAEEYEIVGGRKAMSHVEVLGAASLDWPTVQTVSHQCESIMTGFNLLKIDNKKVEAFSFNTSSREVFDQNIQKFGLFEKISYSEYREQNEKRLERSRKHPLMSYLD
ncbi:MAG: hypothetical protein ACFFBD_23495 [Candidatus Hodarchaeota archaeon]